MARETADGRDDGDDLEGEPDRYVADDGSAVGVRAKALTWARGGALALVVGLIAIVLTVDHTPPDKVSTQGALAFAIPGAKPSLPGSALEPTATAVPTDTTAEGGELPTLVTAGNDPAVTATTTTTAAAPRHGAATTVPPTAFPTLPSPFGTTTVPPSTGMTLFPVPTAGGTFGLTLGPDGNVWFTQSNGDVVGRITPAGVVTEFHTPTPGSQPTAIVTGPDGNLWFVEKAANNVARMTTAGVITEFPIPTPFSDPQAGMAVGPDGAIWFAERSAGQIGRVTMDGVITEFPVGSDSQPVELVHGVDGNLWFLMQNRDRLARITPAGTVTEFAYNLFPGYIISGLGRDSHGNLWFQETKVADVPGYDSVLVRRDPAGQMTPFSLPDNRTDTILGIVEAPDGAIWFAETSTNRIGRLGTDGSITQFDVHTPVGLAIGGDGNLWFTTGPGNSIGRLELD